jgi:hypothetical protein
MSHSDNPFGGAGEYIGATDQLRVDADTGMSERIGVRTSFHVERWDEEQTAWTLRKVQRDFGAPPWHDIPPAQFAYYGVRPYLVTHDDDCNLVTEQGWAALLGSIAGTSITLKFSATAARIGVGTSATAANGADLKLTGDTGGASTTSYYKLVSGAPVITTTGVIGTLVFTAVFGTAVANFAWAEFGTDNGSADSVTITPTTPCFLNHGISAQGTKASGQTWTATETLSFGYPSGSGTLS